MNNPKSNVPNRHHRKLEELNLLDNFLFQEMVSHKESGEEFCRILLGTILGRPIRKVRIVPQKNILGVDTDRRGIRMDAYIEDVSDSFLPGELAVDADITADIYDLEPNKRYEKKSLPKRMRYYHGLIDTQLLVTAMDYEKLPRVVIIVILPYDPFARNRMVYTIQNQCIEDTSIPYDDGATKIFLYTKGTEGNPGKELKDMLKYIEETIDNNVTNQDIETINNLVNRVKQSKEVNINYMKSWEWEKMIREEATQEGRQEGLQKGIEEGLQKGIEEGIRVLIKTCRDFHASREETLAKVMQNFHLPKESAEKYVSDFWI